MSDFFPVLTRRVNYSAKLLPDGGTEFYSYEYYRENFRHEIAEDCIFRCVYCDCHENEVGGRDVMELDHFRPWSREAFAKLKNDPSNLHHSCGRCNRLKGSQWPAKDPAKSYEGKVGFIDPFSDKRSDFFEVKEDGSLMPKKAPAEYIIRLLQLDRKLLQLLRLRRRLRKEVAAFIEKALPEFEAAASGQGNWTREQLGEAGRKLCEYKRLLDLCDAPL